MTIKKAIITCAGFGTRFLPISKTIQKEMLPILNRPIIDYIVGDCIQAGIDEIIFVINEHNYQVLHYYRENQRLYHYLKKMDKVELYAQVEHLHQQAQFHFVKQKDSDPYGTAVPVQLAQKYIQPGEAFLVFMGDDFIFSNNGKSEAAKMIKLFNDSQAKALATCIQQPTPQLHRYGIAQIKKTSGFSYLTNLVEKPDPGTAPSNLANISKYILTSDVFEIIAQQKPNSQSGELYITDTISTIAQHSPVVIHQPQGVYLDGGNVASWLKANLTVAKNDKKLYQELKQFLQEF